jgi:hypothetical protein
MTALGFGPSPRPRYIYLNRQYPECLWYFWDHAGNKPEPIAHGSLTGTLTGIELLTKEFRGKPDPKIDLYLKCDRNYKLQIGLDTTTAKSLLSALSQVKDFSQPMTIVPEPGDTDQVLFGKIAIDGEVLFAPYADNADWPAILQTLINRLGGETPQAVTEAPRSQSAPLPKLTQSQKPSPSLPTLPPHRTATAQDDRIITDQQRKDFAALTITYKWSTDAVKLYLGNCGYMHSSTIAPKDYESICEGIRQVDTHQYFEDKATIVADQLGTWEDAA